MVIGVLGGTGQLGGATVAELRRRGHRAVVLSRRPPEDGGEHRPVDVESGVGLAFAMCGLDAVVETLNGPPGVLVWGTERALAAARVAGVEHVVSLSAAGAGRVPHEYYRAKAEQEAVVRSSGVPWSIVRAAQLHSLLDTVFAAGARRGLLPLLRAPLEPVDRVEVAAALADRVEAGPDEAVTAFAGPHVERLDRLARQWARARGVRRLPVVIPAVTPLLQAVRDGGLIDPAPVRGRVSFADWLGGPPRAPAPAVAAREAAA
jgi:uncharacterized protein YbjT (DUF2867 family)